VEGIQQMTENDINLIKQLITAGKMGVVHDLMPEYNMMKSKAIIEQMGEKWCCHPNNKVKRLETPLEILKQHQSRVLRRSK
jgi:hypothetical protein